MVGGGFVAIFDKEHAIRTVARVISYLLFSWRVISVSCVLIGLHGEDLAGTNSLADLIKFNLELVLVSDLRLFGGLRLIVVIR